MHAERDVGMSEPRYEHELTAIPVTGRYRGYLVLGLFTALPLVLGSRGGPAMIPVVFAVLMAVLAPDPGRRPVPVRVTDERLHVGRQRVDRRKIASAAWLPDREGVGVALLDEDEEPLVQLVGFDRGTIDDLLEALSLSPPATTVFLGTSPLMTGPLGGIGVRAAIAGLPVLIAAFARLLPLLWPAALLALVLAGTLFTRSRIQLGKDGVDVMSITGHRFVPYEAIGSVEATDTHVVLERTDGGTTRVPVGYPRANPPAAEKEQVELVAKRIEQAAEARRRAAHDSRLADLLARRGRSVTQWRQDLAELTHHDLPYREADVTEEALWRVLEDPAADPSARAGAAILLRRALDDGIRERLRIARQGVAEPQLRIVLDRAADEDDEALEDALDSWVAEEEARRAAAPSDPRES